MVQQVSGGNSLQHGGYYAPRENNWARGERSYPDNVQQEAPRLPIIAPAHQHEPCPTIEAALRQCVRIDVKKFALIVELDTGEHQIFSSASLKPDQEKLFTQDFKRRFNHCVRKADVRESNGYHPAFGHDGSMYSDYDAGERQQDRKQSSSFESSSENGRRQYRKSRSDESDEGSFNTKKRRMRAGYPGRFRDKSEDDIPVPVRIERQSLIIGNTAEVEQFYHVRFKDMQQSACKVMGKVFVKLVEPKKQTHHPYTKGDEKKPAWWPPTTGENAVRHKEPDHLLKPERTRLLVWILLMIVKPPQEQDPAIRKLNLTVDKLKEVTMEAMSNWFNDKEHPENEGKKAYLREIFKVAKQQARFLAGGLDGSTAVPVSCGDRLGLGADEDSDDEGLKAEDDTSEATMSSEYMSTPAESLVSPTLNQNQNQALAELENAQMRLRPSLPLRHHSTQLEDLSAYNENAYHYSRGMNYMPPSPNIDLSRRNFANPVYATQQQPVYQMPWSNGMPIPNQPATSYYSPPQPQPQPQVYPHAPMLPPLGSQHMNHPSVHSSFDSIHNGLPRFDSGQSAGNQLRTGSLGHPHQMGPQPQHEYMDDGSFGQHHEMKEEHQQHYQG